MKRKWRIRKDLVVGTRYGGNGFTQSMEQYVGDTFKCTEEALGGAGYLHKDWRWTRSMVEPVTEKPTFKYGDMIYDFSPNNQYAYVTTLEDGRVITAHTPIISIGGNVAYGVFVWEAGKDWKLAEPIKEESKVVEVTLEDIASTMGVNVANLKIIKGDK